MASATAWKRFPVPEFDYRSLKGLAYDPPAPIPADEADRIAAAARAGDRSVAGAYAVEPDAALLESLAFQGDPAQMILCAAPGDGARLLGRSNAWYNQRAYFLDRNAADAATLLEWRTPRPNNTRFGPEDGLAPPDAALYLLSGRILANHALSNRLMIQSGWSGDGRSGFRVIAACDSGANDFHDSCFEFSWAD